MKRACILLLALSLSSAAALAAPITYVGYLSGPNEAPPNASPGVGFTTVIFDPVAHSLIVDVSFSGLLGTTTASHIHCCTTVPLAGTAGVATQTPTFTGFPLGVTSGTYFHTFDTSLSSSWNPAFITSSGGTTASAEAALAAGLAAGESYLNIHTSAVGAGEIRAFLVPAPEPGTLALGGAAVAALLALRRKRE